MSKERTASLIFLFSGIYGLVFGMQLPLGSLREPGPGMLPLSISSLLLLSGILWFLHGKRTKEGKTAWYGTLKEFSIPLKIAGVTAAFILMLEHVGYLFTALIYLFILFSWISRYRFWIALGLSLLIGFGSWYFFGRILSVRLPKGVLFP